MNIQNKNKLHHNINGLTVSTVKIGKDYETMVLDQFGNELKVMTVHYKCDARSNHYTCLFQYADPKNCIHAI